jgi:hypothetical protein
MITGDNTMIEIGLVIVVAMLVAATYFLTRRMGDGRSVAITWVIAGLIVAATLAAYSMRKVGAITDKLPEFYRNPSEI